MSSKKSKAASTSTPSSSPEGLALNLAYSVGRHLGSGAQASVYAVVQKSTQEETSWVVKMAPLPDKPAPPKKKKGVVESNADSLNGEYHVYDLFKSAQGSVIPALPLWKNAQRDVPVRGELTTCDPKYRFLVLERMDAPFFALVDELLAAPTTGDIVVGPLFVRMFEHAQTFHNLGHVFVDVKADNFMLAKAGATASSSSSKTKPPPGPQSLRHAQQLADRIRWMDLALTRKYRNHLTGNGTHVENLGGQSLVGTPLYCSLHAHDGATLARRDDAFAILLVLCELVIRLQAALDHTTESYQPNLHNQFPSFLPWANESSLEQLGTRKKELVLDAKSELYRRMPSNVASHMHQWLVEAHHLSYPKEPPYDDWKAAMQSLSVPAPAAAKAAAGRRKLPATKTTATTRRKVDAPPLAGTAAVARDPKSTAPAGLKDGGKISAQPKRPPAKRPQIPADSAVEPVQKLAKPAPVKPPPTAAPSTRARKKASEDCDAACRGDDGRRASATDATVLGIVLRAIEGPLQGKSFYPAKGHCDLLVLGSAPPSKTGKAISIPGDSLDKTHAKLSLLLTAGGSRIVKVESLGKGAACTTVNNAVIARNASGRAFPNDTIGLGSSVFKVSYFDEPLSRFLGKENNDA